MTALLEHHGFFFKKKLGQNFLMNEPICCKIADASYETMHTEKKKLAVEIGPGAGALTRQLSKRFDSVLALEIDPHLIPVLEESLKDLDNITVINTDALVFPYASLPEHYPDYEIAICSNLPYYITSELIMRFLESDVSFSSVTVLIQKEAAVRMVSKPGSADYGSITAAVSYYAKAERLFPVGPGNFIPKPTVDSAVLRLIPYDKKPVQPKNEALFFQLIRASFSNRRKTLSNALSSALSHRFTKEMLLSFLNDAKIDPLRRGETLSLEEFQRISDIISIFEEQNK